MAGYRDETETLRNRVAQLERELAERDAGQAEGEDRVEVLRKERDEARRARDALREERDALAGEVERLASRLGTGLQRWLRDPRSYVLGLATAVVLAIVVAMLAEEGALSFAVYALATALLVVSVLWRASAWARRPEPDDVEQPAPATDRASKARTRARVRVEVERHDAAVAAHRERLAAAKPGAHRAKRRKHRV